MTRLAKHGRIFIATFLALVFLVAGTQSASAGSLKEAISAWKEYKLVAPQDDVGIFLLQEAIYCFALALEKNKVVPDPADLNKFKKKCRAKDAGVLTDDPDIAQNKGLLDLTGGLISAVVEILQKT